MREDTMRFYTVDIAAITPPEPKEQFDPQIIEELATQILECQGLLKPIILKSNGPESYVVVDGHREYYAAVRAQEKNPRIGEMVNAFVISPKAERSILNQLAILNSQTKPSGLDQAVLPTASAVPPPPTPQTTADPEAPRIAAPPAQAPSSVPFSADSRLEMAMEKLIVQTTLQSQSITQLIGVIAPLIGMITPLIEYVRSTTMEKPATTEPAPTKPSVEPAPPQPPAKPSKLTRTELHKLTKTKLKELAKERKIPRYTKMDENELIDALVEQ